VFVTQLAYFISILFQIYRWLIIAYILISWVPQLQNSSIGNIIRKLVEPYLAPFKRFIPPLASVDFSPIVALFALIFIEIGVMEILKLFM
jgi:uncharacterized protein YggT (Ycf19 family)